MAVASGVVAFESLRKTDVYLGQDTGRYTLTLTLDDGSVSPLEDAGVKVKEYEGKKQRKFASKFPVKVIDANDQPVEGPVPYGSKVRVLYNTGPAHPVHGTPTYMNAVRVIELAEAEMDYGEL